MERMVNQNDNHDIIDDYKYWEDQSDLYKDDGNLLPLEVPVGEGQAPHVTCIAWNPQYNDLFAVGYGSYEFQKQRRRYDPLLHVEECLPYCHTRCQPACQPLSNMLDSGVMCLDFHPTLTSLLACGLYDGSVCIFDLKQRSSTAR